MIAPSTLARFYAGDSVQVTPTELDELVRGLAANALPATVREIARTAAPGSVLARNCAILLAEIDPGGES